MGKIIEVLKNQLDIEIKNAEEKLTSGNLDTIYKLSSAITYLCDMEHDGYKAEETAESTIKKYSNGRYDHNIDALYDAYIAAKKQYKEVGDTGHREKLMECVGRLMTEVYDMISCMIVDSDFREEREEVKKQVRMLSEL
jgi:hypothetical protein